MYVPTPSDWMRPPKTHEIRRPPEVRPDDPPLELWLPMDTPGELTTVPDRSGFGRDFSYITGVNFDASNWELTAFGRWGLFVDDEDAAFAEAGGLFSDRADHTVMVTVEMRGSAAQSGSNDQTFFSYLGATVSLSPLIIGTNDANEWRAVFGNAGIATISYASSFTPVSGDLVTMIASRTIDAGEGRVVVYSPGHGLFTATDSTTSAAGAATSEFRFGSTANARDANCTYLDCKYWTGGMSMEQMIWHALNPWAYIPRETPYQIKVPAAAAGSNITPGTLGLTGVGI